MEWEIYDFLDAVYSKANVTNGTNFHNQKSILFSSLQDIYPVITIYARC